MAAEDFDHLVEALGLVIPSSASVKPAHPGRNLLPGVLARADVHGSVTPIFESTGLLQQPQAPASVTIFLSQIGAKSAEEEVLQFGLRVCNLRPQPDAHEPRSAVLSYPANGRLLLHSPLGIPGGGGGFRPMLSWSEPDGLDRVAGRRQRGRSGHELTTHGK